MERLVVLLFALVAVSTGKFLPPEELNSFQVTYGKAGSGVGYYDMPWTVKEATSQNKWEKIDEDKPLNVDVYSQHEDPRVLLLFDKKGNIAGIRMSFLKEDIKTKAAAGGHTFEFQYDNNPMYEKGKYLGKDLWYTTVIFASPSKLTSGGRNPLNKETDSVAEGLYYKRNGQWMEMSKDECKAHKDFSEANCFPGMGKHYFYKLESEDDCKYREPFFSLYDNGKLIGFGLAGYGSYSKNPKTQSYFEDFPGVAARTIMPKAPKCVDEYISKYGLTMMHVFLQKDASKITCPSQEWRSAHC